MEIGRLIFYGTMGKLIYIHPKCENNCDKTCFTYITVSYFIFWTNDSWWFDGASS